MLIYVLLLLQAPTWTLRAGTPTNGENSCVNVSILHHTRETYPANKLNVFSTQPVCTFSIELHPAVQTTSNYSQVGCGAVKEYF